MGRRPGLQPKNKKGKKPNPVAKLADAADEEARPVQRLESDVVLRDIDVADERLLLPRFLVAKAFGVSVDAAGKWDVKPVIKRGREALYYLPEVVNVRLGGDGKKLDPGQEKARLDQVRREAAELELQKKRGDLVPIDSVCKLVEKEYVIVRQRLLALPTKLANQILLTKTPQEAQDLLREEITKALEDLVYGDIGITAEADAPESAEATAEADAS